MSATQLDVTQVDWELFSVPVEYSSSGRSTPEHLLETVRYCSFDRRNRKREFWNGLTVSRSGALRPHHYARNRQRKAIPGALFSGILPRTKFRPGFKLTISEIVPTPRYELAWPEGLDANRVEQFLKEVLEVKVEEWQSFSHEPRPWRKFPRWLDSRLEDIEAQFFLRNIMRYEYDENLATVKFIRERLEIRGWEEDLDIIRTTHYKAPELLTEFASLLLIEIAHEVRYALMGNDWDEMHGQPDLETLEAKRKWAIDRMYGRVEGKFKPGKS